MRYSISNLLQAVFKLCVRWWRGSNPKVGVLCDGLTFVMDRASILEVLDKACKDRRQENTLSIVFVDLCGLKAINDFHGHNYGDEYLRQFTQSLILHLRPDSRIGRIGGDEFIIIVELESEKTEKVMDRVQKEISGRFTFSFGVSEYPSDFTDSISNLVSLAEGRMRKSRNGLYSRLSPESIKAAKKFVSGLTKK
ncbi:GGDEF domain-containing protein [Candidatus Nomurabacteria bacterium]|nr:GGDEF domain-containing protein [Candidatus Nomurabacteria bacterium]